MQLLVPLLLAAALLGVVLPRVVGAGWAQIGAALAPLSWPQLALLTGVWLLGLYAHSHVLTAAMPRLTRRRAVTLNLTGSAVANLLPLGGSAGIGLNYVMVRSWGFDRAAFARYTVVTNLVDVAAKLTLPALALLALHTVGAVPGAWFTAVAAAAASLLAALSLTVGAVLTDRLGRRVGRGVDRVANRALASAGSRRLIRCEQAAAQLRSATTGLLRDSWGRLAVGMAAYAALQALLLWLCLHLLGSTLRPAQVFAGYAVERLLTLLPVTPGGVGLAEVSAAAALTAFGDSATVAAAGVLLYRFFTFLAEIPVGGLALLAWLCRGGGGRGPDRAVGAAHPGGC